jgi:hypothetical protein
MATILYSQDITEEMSEAAAEIICDTLYDLQCANAAGIISMTLDELWDVANRAMSNPHYL